MPQTVNGIGTNYAGRDNVHISTDTCDSCGAYTNLESFDTTLYFVFVFIPILPVGRKRILNKCPACTYHYAIPLKDWETKKTEGLQKASEGFRANPGSEEHAIEALGAVIAFQDEEEFARLAAALREQMAQNPGVMSELARGYAYFRKPEDAIDILFRAKAMHDDDDDLNGQLAFLLIDQKRPDEAAPLVRHILDKKLDDKVGLLMLLVESFQAVGNHSAALQVLGEIKQEFPDLADDKNVKRAEKLSEKHAASGKKISSKNLGSASPVKPGGMNMGGGAAKWVSRLAILTIALVLTGILYALLSNASGPQEIHIVNGLKLGYEVDINGQQVKIGPGQRAVIKMKEGAVVVRFISGVDYPEQTGDLQTSYWQRMFGDGVRIINPDGCAALIWQKTEYSERPMDQREHGFEIHAGKMIHTFSDIDHEFEDFPETIKTESSRVLRTRIGLWPADAHIIWGALGKMQGSDAAKNYARRLVSMDPRQSVMLGILAQSEDIEAMLELLKPRLEDRPIRIDWHRQYQDLVGEQGRDLVPEYDARLSKEPDSTALLYLRGRAESEQTQAQKFYRQAMTGKGIAAAYATNALAYQMLALGEFDEALTLTNKVMQGEHKDNLNFRGAHLQALLANGKFKEIAELCAKAGEFDVFSNRDLRIHAIFHGEGMGAAKRFCQSQLDEMKKQDYDKQYIATADHAMQAQVKHAAGDLTSYTADLAKAGEEVSGFELALCKGDLEGAAKALEQDQFSRSSSYLLLYIAALQRKDAVDTWRKLACSKLATGDKEEKLMAEWISGKEKPDYKRASSFIMQPPEKAIYLAALALEAKSDKNRSKLLKLAARYNYNPCFPHLFLKQVIKKQK